MRTQYSDSQRVPNCAFCIAARRDGIFAGARAGEITASDLLSRYCTLVYSKTGSYEQTARRLQIDRRTVKSKIDANLLSALRAKTAPAATRSVRSRFSPGRGTRNRSRALGSVPPVLQTLRRANMLRPIALHIRRATSSPGRQSARSLRHLRPGCATPREAWMSAGPH